MEELLLSATGCTWG